MRSTDVPQADRLETIRDVVAAIGQGATTKQEVARGCGVSPRHADYRLNAARVLGLARPEGQQWRVTPRGQALLTTAAGSPEERRVFRDAILQSSQLQELAPDLLGEREPTVEGLARRIIDRAALNESTARRRAGALLSWRRAVLDQGQLPMFPMQPGASGAAAVRPPTAPDPVRLIRLEIEGFGPIRKAGVALRELQVLVGANATGKSTFLDALAFLADTMARGVREALRTRHIRQIREITWCGEEEWFQFALSFSLPKALRPRAGMKIARYEIRFGLLEDGSPGVTGERLYLHPEDATGGVLYHEDTPAGWQRILSLSSSGNAWYSSERREWKTTFFLGSDRPAIHAVQPNQARFPATLRVRHILTAGVQRLTLRPEAMQRPASPLLGTSFQPDGANLALVVREMQQSRSAAHDQWLDHVREALPDIESIDVVERPEDNHTYLLVRYKGRLTLPAWRLSDGSLRILALTLVSFLPADDAIYLIEEPENGIHPQAIEAIYQALSTVTNAQVMIATHSPVFLGVVPPAHLLLFTRPRRETHIVPGPEHPLLSNEERAVPLRDLFAMGVLG